MKEYTREWEENYTLKLVMEEAARCLLCHDAPCSEACPGWTDPAKFIRSVRFRNLKGAAETIRENNAFGAVCARVCPTEKYCEKACSRCGIDRPIQIGKIQRFVTDFEAMTEMKIYHPGQPTGKKVAIIGAGPSGLQAAATLAQYGHAVTVYEAREQAGGWLRYGIPEYRLPNAIVDREIQRIVDLGVKILVNEKIDDARLQNEIRSAYDAVLLAGGAPKGRMLPLFEHCDNVELAVDFLARAKSAKGDIDIDQNVLIVGGGDVAMDVATTLKSLGCEHVSVVAREEMSEFLASDHEFALAHDMDVSIIDGYTPISVEGNCVTFKHVRIPGTLEIQADKVILACGQASSLEDFPSVPSNRGIVETMGAQTSQDKIFACGDIVDGDKSVVYGVRTGKIAANAIHLFLQGGE